MTCGVPIECVAYHLLDLEQLLALLCQIHICDCNLPPLITPAQVGARRPSHNLMPKANAHDLHPAALNRLLGVLHKLHYPRVVVEGGVSRPRNQNRIDLLQRGIRVQLIHNVIPLDSHELLEACRRVEELSAGVEECGEDACVAAELVAGLGLGSIGLEDGESKRGSHRASRIFRGQLRWRLRIEAPAEKKEGEEEKGEEFSGGIHVCMEGVEATPRVVVDMHSHT